MFNSYPCILPGLSGINTRYLIITNKLLFVGKRALANGQSHNEPNSAQMAMACVKALGPPSVTQASPNCCLSFPGLPSCSPLSNGILRGEQIIPLLLILTTITKIFIKFNISYTSDKTILIYIYYGSSLLKILNTIFPRFLEYNIVTCLVFPI